MTDPGAGGAAPAAAEAASAGPSVAAAAAPRHGGLQGFASAFGMAAALMLLVAGGVADRGLAFPATVLGLSALAVGVLHLLFPHGPEFALGTSAGLAMYACLFVVIGRAGFPGVAGWALSLAYALPVVAFVATCWARRRAVRRIAQQGTAAAVAADLAHLPRFARWLGAVGAVGVVCLSLPVGRLDPGVQAAVLLAAMAALAAISASAVADVVRLLVDMAVVFRAVVGRIAHLAAPIAAYTCLWALLAVVFGCLYRIADALSPEPLFHGTSGPLHLGFADAMHFSVVTLSTVGYGDIMPRDDGIRLLATLQMLLAQLLLLFGFLEIVRGRGIGGSGGGGGGGGDEGPT